MEAAPPAERIEALLAESAWVRRLAARLVADPDEAEDLAQETWLAALRRPPRDPGSPRPWLATVLKNAARHRARGRSARTDRERDRERGAAESEAPEVWLERLETQELLSQLVRELPEELREVCLLRFWEGLDSRAIGARLSIPDGTVRWRQKCALDRLRERLDTRHDGDRATWVAALAPLARWDAGSAAQAGALSGTLAGGLAVPFTLKLALTATIAALLVTLLVDRQDPPEVRSPWEGLGDAEIAALEDPTDAVESPEPESAQGDTSRTPVPHEPADVAASVEPSRPVTRLALRVLDAAGRPVEGARVTGQGSGDTQTASEELVRELSALELLAEMAGHEALTDDEGRAELSTRLIVETGHIVLRAEGPRFGVWTDRVAVEPGETLELGDVRLTPGGAIAGRAFDEHGRPLAKALVRAMPDGPLSDEERVRTARFGPPYDGASATADDDGAFLLVGVPDGTWRAWARPADESRWGPSDAVVIGAGHRATVDVRLEHASDEADRPLVRVLTPDGELRPDAWLEVRWSEGRSLSGGVGRNAEVWLGDPGERLENVSIRAADGLQEFGPTELELDELAGPVEVRLAPAETVLRRLVVRSVDGRPIEEWNASVTAQGVVRNVDGADGTELRLPATDEFDLSVSAEGWQIRTDRGLLAAALPNPIEVELLELPGIVGLVLSGGEPLARARVEVGRRTEENSIAASGSALSLAYWLAPWKTTTDGDGRFELPVPHADAWLVRARARGHGDVVVELADYDPAVGHTLEIELPEGGEVTGAVRDHHGEPVARRTVVAMHPLHRGKTARTDSRGRFRLRDLAPGDWYVIAPEEQRDSWGVSTSAVAEDFEFPSNVSVEPGTTTELDLVLDDPAALVIRGAVSLGGVAVRPPTVVAWPDPQRDPFHSPMLLGLSRAADVSRDGDRYEARVPYSGVFELTVRAGTPGDPQPGLAAPDLALQLEEALHQKHAPSGSQDVAGRFVRSVEVRGAPTEVALDVELARLEGHVAGWLDPDAEHRLWASWELDGWSWSARVELDAEGRFGPLVVPAGTLTFVRTASRDGEVERFESRATLAPAATQQVGID